MRVIAHLYIRKPPKRLHRTRCGASNLTRNRESTNLTKTTSERICRNGLAKKKSSKWNTFYRSSRQCLQHVREEDVTTTNRLRSVPKRNIARIDRAEQREKMPVTIVLQNSSGNSRELGVGFPRAGYTK